MRKIIMVAVAVAFMGQAAQGQDGGSIPPVSAAPIANAGASYQDVLRACGSEWKARADKDTRKGAAAWQEFRKTCTNGKGWTRKNGNVRAAS